MEYLVGCFPFLLNVFGPGGVVAYAVWWYLRRRGFRVLPSIMWSLAGFVATLFGWLLLVYPLMFSYIGVGACWDFMTNTFETISYRIWYWSQ